MSDSFKINGTLLTVIVTCLITAFSVTYIAGSKSQDIDTAKLEIGLLRADVKKLELSLSTVDERTKASLQMMSLMEGRLHGIASQLGKIPTRAEAYVPESN